MNKTDKNPRSHGVSILAEENKTVNKIINKIYGVPGAGEGAAVSERGHDALVKPGGQLPADGVRSGRVLGCGLV